jgi:hypothetical protein
MGKLIIPLYYWYDIGLDKKTETRPIPKIPAKNKVIWEVYNGPRASGLKKSV